MGKKRIGILGFGHLGRYLVEEISNSSDLELSFVWNRTEDVLHGVVDENRICRDLEDFAKYGSDLVVEVAHPVVAKKYGAIFLKECDFMIGSPTAMADPETNAMIRESCVGHGLYVAAGAFWGADDISKMSDRDTIKGLKVTMRKHPSCFKLESPLKEVNETVSSGPVTLFDGPVRNLCPLAPNNVNTMAVAAIAAENLGFDKVQGCLISDPSMTDFHIVEVEVTGPNTGGKCFTVNTVRKNPANLGVVSGKGTYSSFYSSLRRAGRLGPGVHIC